MITSTRAGSLGAVNPQNQIILYGGFANYGVGFNANGELATVVNSVYRSSIGTNIDVGLGGWLRFNSASGLSGSWDTQYGRNATGPTAEIRAAGGLIVNNAAGSANAAVACGEITSSILILNDISGSHIRWSGGTRIYCGVNGNLTLYNSGLTDFGRLNFGGLTSSFPALKRSGATLQARLADDSAFANFSMALGFVGPYTVATLPSAAANDGAFARVTDSSVTTNGSTVAGGGGSKVPVFSDGTNWIVK
jgi:hypothetical protein